MSRAKRGRKSTFRCVCDGVALRPCPDLSKNVRCACPDRRISRSKRAWPTRSPAFAQVGKFGNPAFGCERHARRTFFDISSRSRNANPSAGQRHGLSQSIGEARSSGRMRRPPAPGNGDGTAATNRGLRDLCGCRDAGMSREAGCEQDSMRANMSRLWDMR